MKPLQPPDSLHLLAAEGWLELGDPVEAGVEVQKIKPRLRIHPDVLEVRWSISAKAKDWGGCQEIAKSIIRAVPERASGWVNLSFALHELKQTEEAFQNLLSVASHFPANPLVPYNLACYACQMGRQWEAKQWLGQACKTGDLRKIKLQASEDVDLKPLWGHIENL